MPFQIAEADLTGVIDSGTIYTLYPGPTYVDYPPRFEHNVRVSRDGNPIIQAPLSDGRVRKWVWQRYRFDTPRYTTLFNKILNLQYKLRLLATPAKSEYVFLKEDVSENLSPLAWGGGVWAESDGWIRVKVTNVTQNVAHQGGKVIYEETVMEFVIADPTWNTF